MTDLDELVDLFNKLGIQSTRKTEDTTIVIALETGNTKVVGYGGFTTDFTFNLDGSFIDVGIWE